MSCELESAHSSQLRTQNSELRTSMSLLRLCEWLAATPGSIALHESRYLYLVVLSVHVLTLCLFVGTAAMIDLRLMGLTMQRVRFSEVIARLLPWTTAGFLLMIGSGALLFYAAPLVRYQNIFFRVKMAALMLAALNVDRVGTHDSLSSVLVRLQQTASARNPELACGLCVCFAIGTPECHF